MSIIGFLIFGLVIGLIARAIFPGRQQMGWLSTAVLGMIGSLVGGLIGHALFGNRSAADGSWGFTPGGWISSSSRAAPGATMTSPGRPLPFGPLASRCAPPASRTSCAQSLHRIALRISRM